MPHRIVVRLTILSMVSLLSACAIFGGRAQQEAEPVVTTPAAAAPAAAKMRPPSYQPQPARQAAPAVVQYDTGAVAVPLKPGAPERYTVKRGDTLWDISALFLDDPWLWPEIWYVNPQIENPHLIYPGDVLRLVWVDGRPRIMLERDAVSADVRLSPEVRYQSLDQAITAIPYEAIASFISRPTVLDKKTIESSPYILDIRESHLVAGSGFHVYVRGTDTALPGTRYRVYHVGAPLYDPDKKRKRLLGYEGLYVGEGRITANGDPSTMFLTETRREALIGDLLIVEQPRLPLTFFPSAPEQDIDGRIISVIDGVSLIGTYQIVTLNRGAVDGLAPGHVLSVFRVGKVIHDPNAARNGLKGIFKGKQVKLPDEHAGELMIFRALDEMSFGLVMHATSEIKVLDAVRTPR